MKKLSYLLFTLAALAAMTACDDKTPADDGNNTTIPPVVIPDPEEEFIDAFPDGQDDLTFDIKATEGWTIAPEEKYGWIEVTPKSGKGDTKLTFKVDANDSGKERSAIYTVTEGENDTYIIMVSQAKMESNVNETDLEFLQAVVNGNMLGEDTPAVDNWFSVDPNAFVGITLSDKDGKFFITRIDGAPMTDFPEKMHLPELEWINLRSQKGLSGKHLPADWSTPKLIYLCLAATEMTGVIPDGVGQTPVLREIYMDGCNFYGALPHVWTSTALEAVLLATYNSNNAATSTDTSNSGLGYMIPASLDVKLNILNEDGSHNNPSRDFTQMKVGGVKEGNFIGFEKGWGQIRYEKYDADAVAGNLELWSEHRLLLDEWAYYFSNLNVPEMLPQALREWDQDAADAYTAKCIAAAQEGK